MIRRIENPIFYWVNIPDFSPLDISKLIIPTSRLHEKILSLPGNIYLENISLKDRFYGFSWYDSMPGLKNKYLIKAMIERNLFYIDEIDDLDPKTYISHRRIGPSGERSILTFSRRIGSSFIFLLGASLTRGDEYRTYGEWEKQNGILKCSFSRNNLSINGFIYHNFTREGFSDSSHSSSVIDFGEISLKYRNLNISYRNRYNYKNDTLINENIYEHLINISYDIVKRSKFTLGLSTGIEFFSPDNDNKYYSLGLNSDIEVFPLTTLSFRGKIKSDTSYSTILTLMSRLSPNTSIYSGLMFENHSYPLSSPQNGYNFIKLKQKAFIGSKLMNDNFVFDIALGWNIEREKNSYQNNEWISEKDSVDLTGGIYFQYEMTKNISFYTEIFSESDQRGYSFIKLTKHFFKDDLRIDIIPGVIYDNIENFHTYPELLIKVNILSLNMYWRTHFEDNNNIFDYGFLWIITN